MPRVLRGWLPQPSAPQAPDLRGAARWAEQGMARLLQLGAGAEVVAQVGRVARQLYPPHLGGSVLRERLRLWFRSLVFLGATARLSCFFGEADRGLWLERQPALLEKPHRPYMLSSLDAWARAELVCTHYALAEAGPQRELWRATALAPCVLATLAGRSGGAYTLSLSSCQELPKEGEAVLTLSGGGLPGYRLAFSLGLRDGLRVAYIGCLQGPGGAHMREVVREVTQDLQGARPRDVLLAMAQVIFEALQVQTVLGVGSSGHVYRHWRKRRQLALCYDTLWTEFGGSRYSPELFRLPLRFVQRPLSEYPSKKRAQAARRQALMREAARQVLEAISPGP